MRRFDILYTLSGTVFKSFAVLAKRQSVSCYSSTKKYVYTSDIFLYFNFSQPVLKFEVLHSNSSSAQGSLFIKPCVLKLLESANAITVKLQYNTHLCIILRPSLCLNLKRNLKFTCTRTQTFMAPVKMSIVGSLHSLSVAISRSFIAKLRGHGRRDWLAATTPGCRESRAGVCWSLISHGDMQEERR